MSDVVEISVAATVKDAEGNLTLHSPFKPLIAQSFGAGEDVTIIVRAGEEPASEVQRKGFHAMVRPWCDDAGHDINQLKLDLLGEIFGWSETPSPLTGRILPIEQHTSKLPKKKYSLLIERTMEIAARMGYVLIAPDEYRAMHPEKYGPRWTLRNIESEARFTPR